MTPLLLAFALHTAPAADEPTAGQLYEGCVRYAAIADAAIVANTGDEGVANCAIIVASFLATNAAGDAIGADRGDLPARVICLPDSIWQNEGDAGVPLAQAFIAYVDGHRTARGENGSQVFQRALAQKWPCPR